MLANGGLVMKWWSVILATISGSLQLYAGMATLFGAVMIQPVAAFLLSIMTLTCIAFGILTICGAYATAKELASMRESA